MTFDLSPEQLAVQGAARRAAAETVAPAAAAIDAGGEVPPPVLTALAALDLSPRDAMAAALATEELAAASASAAARVVLGGEGANPGLAGLRGVRAPSPVESRHYLGLAAVCLGIGRAAVEVALAVARARGDRPSGEPGDPPHWTLADAATDVDAARLLVHAVALGQGLSPAAALVHAATAANRAVEAALRVVGPDGYRPGSALERYARDARAAWLVLGSEDGIRKVAADALLT